MESFKKKKTAINLGMFNYAIKPYHFMFNLMIRIIILLTIKGLPCNVSDTVNIFSSVPFSHSVVSNSLRPHGLQHARPSCPSPTPGVCSNSCPLSRWCHPTISSSVISLSCCLQSFPSIRVFSNESVLHNRWQKYSASTLASVLPMKIQDWFLLGLTGLISLKSKRLSRVFFNTTIQKHQFFGTQLSLWCNSHIHTWLLEKP